MSFVAKLANSVRCAGRGLRLTCGHRNMRIMVAVGAVVVAMAGAYQVSGIEWAVLLVSIGGVTVTEATNTAIERLADRIELEYDVSIRDIKDVAAGAALLASMVAAAVGVVIFWPYVLG